MARMEISIKVVHVSQPKEVRESFPKRGCLCREWSTSRGKKEEMLLRERERKSSRSGSKRGL